MHRITQRSRSAQRARLPQSSSLTIRPPAPAKPKAVGLMGADDDRRREELLRRFEAVIGGAELDDLRQLAGDLSLLGATPRRARGRHERRDLRRPPLPHVRIFRVRADLKRSQPRIWRRLELRSDVTLDVVHRVLQTSFAWLDYTCGGSGWR